MDALLTRSGVIDAKTDITKAEIYLRTAPGTALDAQDMKREIEDVFGYGFRSLEITSREWDKLP